MILLQKYDRAPDSRLRLLFRYSYCENVSEIRSSVISDRVHVLIKEMFKGPMIALAKELFPGASESGT